MQRLWDEPLPGAELTPPLGGALLAHELRAPLTTLRGAALTLARRHAALAPAERTRLLEDLAAEAERLNQMVENLLEISRGDAAVRLATEPVALRPLLRRVVRGLRPTVGRGRIVCRLPAGLPPVEAEPVALAQVLHNLLDNAARYSPGEAPVTVTARLDGGRVRLRVCDRGPGIPEEQRERVFAPFVRLRPTDRQGLGLGLAVCRRLIAAQGGDIRIEGRRKGPGAAVVVTLAAAQE